MKKPELRDIQNEFWRQIKNKDGVANVDECRELGELFLSHYESNGWMVGKTKMKQWKKAVRTWVLQRKRFMPKWKAEQREQQKKYQKKHKTNAVQNHGEIDYEAYKKRQKPITRRERMGFADKQYEAFKKQYLQQRRQDATHRESQDINEGTEGSGSRD